MVNAVLLRCTLSLCLLSTFCASPIHLVHNETSPFNGGSETTTETNGSDGGTYQGRRGQGLKLHSGSSDGENAAEKFLVSYGYLDRLRARSRAGLKAGVRLFQQFYGLPVTGVVDNDTKQLMEKARCGKSDIAPNLKAGKGKWPKTDLTYRIEQYPNTAQLSQAQTINIIKDAFQKWSVVTPLKFQKINSKSDIEIKFVKSDHGDWNSFDGPGGVLAHAFFPSTVNGDLAGDAHFDNEDNFVAPGSAGVSLLKTAIHEFGHSLGLDHSQSSSSIMYAYIVGTIPAVLSDEDVKRIQDMYGENTGGNPGSPEPPVEEPSPDPPGPDQPWKPEICKDGQVDAITSPLNNNQDIRGFRGASYIKMKKDNVEETKDLSTLWDVTSIDSAAYLRTHRGEWLYLIKDSSVMEIHPNNEGEKYSITRSQLFYGIPPNVHVDAIIRHPQHPNYIIYVFSGTQYYRLSRDGNYYKVTEEGSYPRSISAWKFPSQLQSGVDAATRWNNRLYFFKGQNYWRYNLNFNGVDSGYPKDIKKEWFHC